MRPILGHNDNDNAVAVDVDRLLISRLLVQANSGAGKSWALRRLLEQTHGLVQHIVLDAEGEFHTLRERYDYILARPREGDCVAHPRTAKLLAHKLLELGVSAVVDIYELKAHERMAFVRLFLSALVDAPKTLWHPALIVVDEAHIFCPQVGNAESAGAVIDLMTRGRKRGFAGILATQRISKLHKDAAAEANNKLIGRSALDVDMKRAADELGFSGREEQLRLRTLQPGQFFAFGPALTPTVTEIHIGEVKTTHPKPGQRALAAPPPSAKVKALLAKLTDLPKEAEEEAKTMDDLRRTAADLRRQLTLAQKAQPVVDHEAITRFKGLAKFHETAAVKSEKTLQDFVARGLKAQSSVNKILTDFVGGISQIKSNKIVPTTRIADVAEPVFRKPTAKNSQSLPSGLSRPHQRILDAVAWFTYAPTKIQVAFMAGYTAGTGAVNNYFGQLRSAGLLDYPSAGTIQLTDEGRNKANMPDVPATSEALQNAVYKQLSGPLGRILRPLVEAYPESLTKEDLAEQSDYTAGTGAFNNYLGRLRSLGLIDYPSPGLVAALPELFI